MARSPLDRQDELDGIQARAMTRRRGWFERSIDNRMTRRVRPSLDRVVMRHGTGIAGFQYLMKTLSPKGRSAVFHQSGSCAKPALRSGATRSWVEDGPSCYDLPLRAEQAAFVWAAALGALGHDAGIKSIHRELAEAAVAHGERVRFVDVGANFG